MKQEIKKKLIHRLKILEGQIRGLQKMIGEDKYCIDILRQSLAVQNALRQAEGLILEQHLQKCVREAMKKGGKKKEKSIRELLKVFKLSSILIILALGVSVAGAVERHSLSIEEALKPILESQSVSDISKIDCQKIADENLEMLGDAVMGKMLGSSKQHEIMDKMMGGEGSASLKAGHKNMGLGYLGCGNWSNFNNLRNYNPMMGNFGFNNMMGWGWGWSFFGWVTMILFWALLVVVIAALVKWLLADKNKRK